MKVLCALFLLAVGAIGGAVLYHLWFSIPVPTWLQYANGAMVAALIVGGIASSGRS